MLHRHHLRLYCNNSMANTPTSSATLSFLLFLLLAPFTSASEYAYHCNSVVPESSPTNPFIGSYYPYISNGFFSGGSNLFRSNLSSPSFDLRSTRLRKTRSPGVLQLDATFLLHGANVSGDLHNSSTWRRTTPYGNSSASADARFDLSGFWSESTGELCMIGRGGFFRPGHSFLPLSAVLRLQYPKTSNISTSLVRGNLTSLSEINSPNHFDPIWLLAYAQNNYNFTMISQANSSCASHDQSGEENDVALDPDLACGYMTNLAGQNFNLDGCRGRSCKTLARSFGFSTRFISFRRVSCGEGGKFRLLIQFSNSSNYEYASPPVPEKSLVAEGYWDAKKDKLCIIACSVIQQDSDAGFAVGDCSVGLSLWFPAVLSLRNRSYFVGRMRSNKDENAAGYFDAVSFRPSLSNHMLSFTGRRYEYTEKDSISKSCAAVIRRSPSPSSAYPDATSSADMQFDSRFQDAAGRRGWVSAKLFSAGDVVYGDGDVIFQLVVPAPSDAVSEFELSSSPPAASRIDAIKNVSYTIDYIRTPTDSPFDYVHERIFIAAEGIYNGGTGALCMKGCRYPDSVCNSTDCEILINIQLPAMVAKVEKHVNGSIRSTRSKKDPLYFEPISFSGRHMYENQVAESMWRMDIEIAMALASLTLSCIFIALQILHSRKHPAALPSGSVAMFAVLAAGYLIPLVLNFDAVFANQRRHSVPLQRGGWVEVDEVVVRVMSLAALFLTGRLLQATWAAKSREESGRQWAEEAKALKMLLPLLFAGALLAWIFGASTRRPELGRHSGQWEELILYAGFVLDGFLLPQVVLNLCRSSEDRALTPFFYGGITATRVAPHLYNAYRSRRLFQGDDSLNFYAARDGDFYSSAWDFAVPCEVLLLAALVFLQQRFGGAFFIPKRARKFTAYAEAPVEEPEN